MFCFVLFQWSVAVRRSREALSFPKSGRLRATTLAGAAEHRFGFEVLDHAYRVG